MISVILIWLLSIQVVFFTHSHCVIPLDFHAQPSLFTEWCEKRTVSGISVIGNALVMRVWPERSKLTVYNQTNLITTLHNCGEQKTPDTTECTTQ